MNRYERPLERPCWIRVVLISDEGIVTKEWDESRHVPKSTRKQDEHGEYDIVRCVICGERLSRL